MNHNSINFKLLAPIVFAFLFMAISVVALANYQLKAIVDRSQTQVYSDKINVILTTIERKHEKLQATLNVETYEADFKESLLNEISDPDYQPADPESYLFIIDGYGTVVMHPYFKSGSEALADIPFIQTMLQIKEGNFDYPEQGEARWVIFNYFKNWDWLVAYSVPLKTKYADVQRFTRSLNLIVIATAGLIIMGLLVPLAKLTRPIIDLTQAASEMAAGNLDQAIHIDRKDEIGILADSFVRMRDSIRTTITALNEEISDRIHIEEALTRKEETSLQFLELLKTLHNVTTTLSTTLSFEALCRETVELGITEMGIDRMALWFLEEAGGDTARGTFGTDEEGNLRDEHDIKINIKDHHMAEIFLNRSPAKCWEPTPLFNQFCEVIGSGWRVIAAIRDGNNVIGCITADNLLKQKPLQDYQLEILTLYGSIVGHLSVLKQAEEEIRELNEELEYRVLQRTVQLRSANKELEAFSYSVSHDLRAPLRSINGFSLALQEDYKTVLDDTGRDYLNRIQLACTKMSHLIDSLLKLSRITRAEIHYTSINLSALAIELADKLHQTDPHREVKFIINPDITVKGDQQLLHIALENLLGNAWKFTQNRPDATIELGMTQVEGVPTYFIKDNGAGFDMTYASRLFIAFQRLHSAAEFEGTGIGLATVQRIIHRHGGRIWAEGAINKGAIFYFTLVS